MPKKFKMTYAGKGVEDSTKSPVDSPTGKGLVKRGVQNLDITVGSQGDDSMEDHSLLNALGDELSGSDAMSKVQDSGVDKTPQGVKDPGHSKARDGITSEVTDNLTKIAEHMDRNAFSWDEVLNESEVGDVDGVESVEGCAVIPPEFGEMTMNEVFDKFLSGSADGESISYEGFCDYCGDEGYEKPGHEDMTEMMSTSPHYMFSPSEEGGSYVKESISLPVNVGDLPGMTSQDGESPSENDLDGIEEDFTAGSPTPALDYGDGDGMEVSPARGTKNIGASVNEESVTTAQLSAPLTTKLGTKHKNSKKASTPESGTSDLKKEGELFKRKIKNDDSADPKKNIQEFVLPSSIKENVKKIMEAVESAVSKFPNPSKYTPEYRVQVRLDDKKFHTNQTQILAEAATDAEELVTIGKANVVMEVMLYEGNQQTGMFVCEVPKIASRGPAIVAEGMIFRFNSLAKRYGKVILENTTHSFRSHPFGTLIKTDIEKLPRG